MPVYTTWYIYTLYHPGYTPAPYCTRRSTGSSGLGATMRRDGALGSRLGIV